MIIATDVRGAAALGLARITGIGVASLGAPDTDVVWRRHGKTGGQVARALDAMPKLRWLHTDTAGVDDLPLAELAARGVVVTKTAAYTEAVAEWIVTAVLMAAKDAAAYVRASRMRRWDPAAVMSRLVAGTRAVIIGQGDIGEPAGVMLRGLGVTVELIHRSLCGSARDRAGHYLDL